MYLTIAAFIIPVLSFIIYKNQVNKLSLSTIAHHALFTCMYYAMALCETVGDNISRSRNRTELVSRRGHVAVVTGGSRGLGYEAVKKLLQCDVCVIIGCRNVAAGESALQRIKESGIEIGNSKCYQLDIALLSSIKKFAETVLENHPEIHILLNNAGIMIAPYEITPDGFENQFATNYLGHCYLSHLLLPRLTTSARATGLNARIVNVSSCVHYVGSINFDDLHMKSGYLSSQAYGQSKLAQMFFTKSLDAKLRAADMPVQVHSVHPGIVYTDIFKGSLINALFPWVLVVLHRNPEEGARSIIHACISPRLASRGGTYITNCTLTETGRNTYKKDVEARLWKTMLDLLKLKSFGGINSQ